ncbi:hypothetical protein [Clostridium intestinale]|uniref:Uncharacterized protein n=1 Tax=Clostridium intestinale TaxID=36845 RepID=A0A7D6ZX63_9CLOT|nr:hypothetical protein [Clostridium intestinale]QLY77815.1 hypothetical protein HZF06_11900 [Clostridium intestinale]
MFNKEELALIISALVTESVNLKRTIVEKRYCCVEELESLERCSDKTEKLVKKVADLLKD